MVYEDETLLGKINDILEVGSGFLFSIETDQDLVKNNLSKQFYIPYQDNFIIKVDISNKRIDVKNSMNILLNS